MHGFSLRAFLFAAAAALVNRISEVNSTIQLVMVLLIVGYLLALI